MIALPLAFKYGKLSMGRETVASPAAYHVLHSKALGILLFKLDRLVRPILLEMLIHNLISLPAPNQQSEVHKNRTVSILMLLCPAKKIHRSHNYTGCTG